jgi:hypothetical protein
LIKICQINNYQPLELEAYYQNILPTFHLLRRTDGSKYTTQSLKTVRSAMLSNRLFSKNEDGKYELNIENAFNYLKMIQKKKMITEKENLNYAANQEAKLKKKEKKEKKISKKKLKELEKEQKLLLKAKQKKEKNLNGKLEKIKKYEQAYSLLKNLLSISSNDENLYSKLIFDAGDIDDNMELNDKNPNINKIIGMLTVFKFFKPFLEKSFNSIKIQEKIVEKMTEINSQVNSMDSIFQVE